MKFGLQAIQVGRASDGPPVAEWAQLVERLGYESLWASEHVVMPGRRASPHPYSADGELHRGPDVERPAPLIWLSFAAAATTRLRLGTGIAVVPLHNPVVFAKEVATLDRMSGGRLELGVGIG